MEGVAVAKGESRAYQQFRGWGRRNIRDAVRGSDSDDSLYGCAEREILHGRQGLSRSGPSTIERCARELLRVAQNVGGDTARYRYSGILSYGKDMSNRGETMATTHDRHDTRGKMDTDITRSRQRTYSD
nr:hypothetical protein CFP56_36206 [Quercus suber]